MTQTAFGRLVKKRFPSEEKKHCIFYLGIGLRADDEEQPGGGFRANGRPEM